VCVGPLGGTQPEPPRVTAGKHHSSSKPDDDADGSPVRCEDARESRSGTSPAETTAAATPAAISTNPQRPAARAPLYSGRS
jgi:hypothetical protein